jgi:hypothetical protein
MERPSGENRTFDVSNGVSMSGVGVRDPSSASFQTSKVFRGVR